MYELPVEINNEKLGILEKLLNAVRMIHLINLSPSQTSRTNVDQYASAHVCSAEPSIVKTPT